MEFETWLEEALREPDAGEGAKQPLVEVIRHPAAILDLNGENAFDMQAFFCAFWPKLISAKMGKIISETMKLISEIEKPISIFCISKNTLFGCFSNCFVLFTP